jgi:hypothetical protein
MLEEKEINKIGQEGRSICHPSGSCFRSPSYGFGEITHGFFFCTIAEYFFMSAAPNGNSTPMGFLRA